MRNTERTFALTFCVLAAMLSGCASITGTTAQSVSVQTRDQAGSEVTAVACELSNNKGKWFVTTPGSTTITRSNDDMQVMCKKEGTEPGRAAIVSATKGSMWGNIIFGGGIGAIVDHNNGSAYEYPNFIQVVMGAFTRVEPPKETQTSGASQAGSSPIPASPGATTSALNPTASGAPVSFTPASTPVPVSSLTMEEKLADLKRLRDGGLVSQEIYLERQRLLLDNKR